MSAVDTSPFLAEVGNTTRSAGGTGPLIARADSGCYFKKVVACCRKVRFVTSVSLNTAVHTAIAKIPETGWKPIPSLVDRGAEVAETSYRSFGSYHRRCVSLCAPGPGPQLPVGATSD